MYETPINPLRARLLRGDRLIGLWSGLCSNVVTEILSTAGFDWILMDTEHSPNELPGLVGQLQALKGTSTSAIVRPAWNDPVLIKRLLDIGFHNFIMPFVQTAEEAERAVSATRYPPAGIRGVAVGGRGSLYGTIPDYWKRIDDEISVIVQIENQTGLDNMESICAVPGVDCIFIGPNDLAASQGHIKETDHPAVQALIRRAAATCRDAGKVAGILAGSVEEARRYIEMGFTFVGVGSDNGLLRSAASQTARAFDDIPVA